MEFYLSIAYLIIIKNYMDIQRYYRIYNVYKNIFLYKANKINGNNFYKSYDYNLSSFELVLNNKGIIVYPIMTIIF